MCKSVKTAIQGSSRKAVILEEPNSVKISSPCMQYFKPFRLSRMSLHLSIVLVKSASL